MKNRYLLLALFVLFSCSSDPHKKNGRTDTVTIIRTDTIITHNQNNTASTSAKHSLTGEWKEHWGVGVETNVKSNDVYQIQLSDQGNFSISTSNKKKYNIDQILFDGRELSFRKQNKLYPHGKFYVYYKLKLRDDLLWMEGPITNNKKQKDYVKWEKMSPEK